MRALHETSPAAVPPGIYPMLYSFFDDRGALRRDPFRVQVDAALCSNAAGVAILGLGTEVSKLSFDERIEILEVVAKRIDGRKPLLVTVYGEWIETRLLSSGARTNPWMAESSDRIIQAGDMVSFDTDLIGPYGYCTDISRGWVTPGKAPTNEQKDIHAIGCEMIAHNINLVRPGMTFRELADKTYQLGEEFIPNRYAVIAHGVGLADEYPAIRYAEDWEKYGYDGVIEANAVLSFEAYVGRVGGHEGIKLENQVLITETGREILDKFPMDLIPE